MSKARLVTDLDMLLDRALAKDVMKAVGVDLADPTPPVEPPHSPPLCQPKPHRVIAWRHDNGLQDSKHNSLELARAYAQDLHYAVYWKYAIMAGRDMVERKLIEED